MTNLCAVDDEIHQSALFQLIKISNNISTKNTEKIN